MRHKIHFLYEFQLVRLDNVQALVGSGVYFDWKRGTHKGSTSSVVCLDNVLSFENQPSCNFSIKTKLARKEAKGTHTFTTKHVELKLMLDLKIKTNCLGTLKIDLSSFTTHEAVNEVVFPFTKVKSSPIDIGGLDVTLTLRITTRWLKIDGKSLLEVAEEDAGSELWNFMRVKVAGKEYLVDTEVEVDHDDTSATDFSTMTDGGTDDDDDHIEDFNEDEPDDFRTTSSSNNSSSVTDKPSSGKFLSMFRSRSHSTFESSSIIERGTKGDGQSRSGKTSPRSGEADMITSSPVMATVKPILETPKGQSSNKFGSVSSKRRTTMLGMGNKFRIPLRFRIIFYQAASLPSSVIGSKVFVTWRRGIKKKNSGKSPKVICDASCSAFWSSDPSASSSSSGSSDGYTFEMICTIEQDIKSQAFEEKTIAISLKKQEEAKSVNLGHALLNLSDFLANNEAAAASYDLVITSRTKNVKAKPMTIKMRIESYWDVEKADSESDDEGGSEFDDGHHGQHRTLHKPDWTWFNKPIVDCLLKDGLRAYEIPPPIQRLVDILESTSLEVEGIFRLSAKQEEVFQCAKDLDQDWEHCDLDKYSPHVLCGTIKHFLRETPEPLVPFGLYADFVLFGKNILEAQSRDEEAMKSLVKRLPPQNLALLGFLCRFLQKVDARSSVNKMTASNLGVVFGPTILRRDAKNEDPMQDLYDNPNKIALFSFIVEQSSKIFVKEDVDFSKVDKQLEKALESSPALYAKLLEKRLENSRLTIVDLQKQVTETKVPAPVVIQSDPRDKELIEKQQREIEDLKKQVLFQNILVSEVHENLGWLRPAPGSSVARNLVNSITSIIANPSDTSFTSLSNILWALCTNVKKSRCDLEQAFYWFAVIADALMLLKETPGMEISRDLDMHEAVFLISSEVKPFPLGFHAPIISSFDHFGKLLSKLILDTFSSLLYIIQETLKPISSQVMIAYSDQWPNNTEAEYRIEKVTNEFNNFIRVFIEHSDYSLFCALYNRNLFRILFGHAFACFNQFFLKSVVDLSLQKLRSSNLTKIGLHTRLCISQLEHWISHVPADLLPIIQESRRKLEPVDRIASSFISGKR